MQEQILEEFVAQLPVRSGNTKRLFVVGMIGLTGSGKSTLAQALSEATGLYAGSPDALRRFLNSRGFEGASPAPDVVLHIAEAASDYLLERGVSHIIDSDLLKFVDSAREKAKHFGAEFYLIDVQCPDEIILDRLRLRSAEVSTGQSNNFSRAGLEEFKIRKSLHGSHHKPTCDFTVHTNQPLEPQLERIVARLKADGVL